MFAVRTYPTIFSVYNIAFLPMEHVLSYSRCVYHIIIPIGRHVIVRSMSAVLSIVVHSRIFQQQNLARAFSASDDLMSLQDIECDLFQRTGILAAFQTWEQAKTFVDLTQIERAICLLFPSYESRSFDELINVFPSTSSTNRSTMLDNKRQRTYGRQASIDNMSVLMSTTKVFERILVSTMLHNRLEFIDCVCLSG
jgi:hypothetical protein